MHMKLRSPRGARTTSVGRPGRTSATRVAVAGATGYTGQELIRLLARHPAVRLTIATSSTASSANRPLAALTHVWDGAVTPLEADKLPGEADVVFLALPDKAAADIGPVLVDAGVKVIDLSGAFRLREADARQHWYPETHRLPTRIAYGLTERDRHTIQTSSFVANPGCYPTASVLAIAPLAEAGLLLPGADVIIDAKSGVSGAGKAPSERTHFSECHGSVAAYGVFAHRHGAEIEQELGRTVTFTPHLVPLDRGILATVYSRVVTGTRDEAVRDVFERAYGDEPFIRLTGGELPVIKQVAHTNFCDIGWSVAPDGRIIVVSVIDNLLKGAAGQAVQNMNVMLGLNETMGLL